MIAETAELFLCSRQDDDGVRHYAVRSADGAWEEVTQANRAQLLSREKAVAYRDWVTDKHSQETRITPTPWKEQSDGYDGRSN